MTRGRSVRVRVAQGEWVPGVVVGEVNVKGGPGVYLIGAFRPTGYQVVRAVLERESTDTTGCIFRLPR